ncbi:MAG TPA: hypothetical protein PK402_03190, partial [Tepidisphaeraceae bacterium]|nr:hypothetical protein [Tepidisphaeraceae bacterium]
FYRQSFVWTDGIADKPPLREWRWRIIYEDAFLMLNGTMGDHVYPTPIAEVLGNMPSWLTPTFTRSQKQGTGAVFSRQWRENSFSFRIPWWMILAIVHVPLPFILRSRRKRHRRENGLCVKCGYDLRSSTERCSECGRVI